MVLFGFIMPWLFVLGDVKTTFFLAFLTYGISLTGLIFGIMGMAMIGLERRRKHKDEQR
jgi:hypothetical protein